MDPTMSRITRAALAMASCVAALAGGAATAHAEGATYLSAVPTGEPVVQLQAAHSGKCLEIEHGKTGNGMPAQQRTCDGTDPAQQWQTVAVAGSSFEVLSVPSGKCLEVENSSTKAGARVQQWTCVAGKQQRWQLVLVDQDKASSSCAPPTQKTAAWT
ncbi:RICIN domain-containing protein [Streptomyces sp. NPDC050617]|uniref:RICIN domain-containing protein n=1 Tax=Streptomyces sp. NPDC050617 TaxID=3154628 RepID=UPI00343CC547